MVRAKTFATPVREGYSSNLVWDSENRQLLGIHQIIQAKVKRKFQTYSRALRSTYFII